MALHAYRTSAEETPILSLQYQHPKGILIYTLYIRCKGQVFHISLCDPKDQFPFQGIPGDRFALALVLSSSSPVAMNVGHMVPPILTIYGNQQSRYTFLQPSLFHRLKKSLIGIYLSAGLPGIYLRVEFILGVSVIFPGFRIP